MNAKQRKLIRLMDPERFTLNVTNWIFLTQPLQINPRLSKSSYKAIRDALTQNSHFQNLILRKITFSKSHF